MGILFLIVAVVVIAAFYKRKKASNLDVESIGKELDNFYQIFQKNSTQLGLSSVSIRSDIFEYMSGSLAGRLGTSAFLSVMQSGGTNDGLARQLGMEVCTLQGKTYYKFVIKRKFDSNEKRAILEHICSNDRFEIRKNVISFDKKSPYIVCKL